MHFYEYENLSGSLNIGRGPVGCTYGSVCGKDYVHLVSSVGVGIGIGGNGGESPLLLIHQ